MTKISAIVTCYNVQEYVAVAMQSILDCQLENLELIVVDDCSTDHTRTIIDAVAAASKVPFQRIYFSRNTVGGVASAANAGLNAATGDIVVFIDGDDWVIPHNLREAIDVQIKSDADFTVCNCLEYWNDSGEYSQYPEAEYWQQLPTVAGLAQRRDILLRMAPFPWRKIYSRNFLERNQIRFPVGDFFFEDNPFHWETTVKAEKVQFIDKPTHVHRMARAGQTVGSKGPKFLKIFDHATIIRDKLVEQGRYKANEATYLDWLYRHILWCAKLVPDGFLNEVFENGKTHLRPLLPHVFWHALAISGFNASDVRKIAAIYLDLRFDFLREF